MFEKRQFIYLIVSGVCAIFGFLFIYIDPAANGFGLLTLWVAPPLLLLAFFLPVFAIGGSMSVSPISGLRNNLLVHVGGLVAFIAAFVTYLLTLEPTASLWDCSEFIASSYKLQVPHTPGTPLALLIGRVFTMMSFGEVSKVAWTLNLMSGLFSALTVWVVYHTIVLFAGKMFSLNARRRDAMICLCAFSGSMCLAFSDSFWFTAVEAETYGIACFFMMVLVWLILSAEHLEEPLKSRRLVLIFYVSGLAYCVHPMCLLALPLLPFAWYRSGECLTKRKLLATTVLGLALVLAINRFVAVGIFELAFSFDLFFVNHLGLPYYSGPVVLCVIIIFVSALLYKRYRQQRRYLFAAVFLVLGFLPYLMLFIRSSHNPPIDETNPENLPLIKAYMNRESYPSSPLVYGPYFDARIEDVSIKKKMYFQGEHAYEVAGILPEYHYDNRQTLLPRMYSNDPAHIEAYRKWTNLKAGEQPTFADNFQFMFRYQLGHMYMRYLMWNFAGRAGDEQGSSWLMPWQEVRASRFDRARNQYWMLPLLLGIVGGILQYRHDRKGFLTNATFFLITGVVLALYLNSTPNEPRERDYIYVGSYIAFSIWIGLGLLSMGGWVSRWRFSILLMAFIALALPGWMYYQNVDDHDRSARTFQVDHARNVLNSCAPNAILFTGGDNDTFPLWYLQEVEGFRTDVRVMVLSYMNTDWYINQLRRSYYNSPAFNLTLTASDYRQYGPNDVLYVQEAIESPIDAKQYIGLLKREHPGLRMKTRSGDAYHILPSRKLRIGPMALTGDTMATGASTTDWTGIVLTVSGDYISKNVLAILDLIVSNEWVRPIYFNFSSLNSLEVDFASYVIQEGSLFRLNPQRNTGGEIPIDTSLSYRNLVEKADYTNLSDSTVYLSYEDHFARMVVPLRQSFNDLAAAYQRQENALMAKRVMRYAVDKLYPAHLPPSWTNLQAAELLVALNEENIAFELSASLFEYQFRRASQTIGSHRLSRLDQFLLHRSAELLAAAGDNSYLMRLDGIRMKE